MYYAIDTGERCCTSGKQQLDMSEGDMQLEFKMDNPWFIAYMLRALLFLDVACLLTCCKLNFSKPRLLASNPCETPTEIPHMTDRPGVN
jgi:hypothetical protein